MKRSTVFTILLIAWVASTLVNLVAAQALGISSSVVFALSLSTPSLVGGVVGGKIAAGFLDRWVDR